jgi:hypothetical protein
VQLIRKFVLVNVTVPKSVSIYNLSKDYPSSLHSVLEFSAKIYCLEIPDLPHNVKTAERSLRPRSFSKHAKVFPSFFLPISNYMSHHLKGKREFESKPF